MSVEIRPAAFGSIVVAALAAGCNAGSLAPDAGTGTGGTMTVRISEWVQAFGANGVMLSVCDDDYGSALDRIAAVLNTSGGRP